jgi:RNA polymerase sigma factor (sigma-70 family)
VGVAAHGNDQVGTGVLPVQAMSDRAAGRPELLLHADFVRGLARALVGGEGDDLAQSAWVRALQAPAPRNPRAFWAQILRRLAANRSRSAQRREAHERARSLPEAGPTPQDVAEREEARQRVVSAVLALDEPFRQVILLRFYEDLPPRAIARRLCVPAATVRTRLSRALDKLRTRLDADERGRRAWAAPLVAWLGAAAVPLGVILMKKVLAAAAVLAVAGLLYLLWPTNPAPQESAAAGRSAPTGVTPVAAAGAAAKPEEAVGEPAQREAQATPGATGRGDLVVRLLYGDDRSPAADVEVTAFRKNEFGNAFSPSAGSKARRTDAKGIARFPSMRAGRTGLVVDLGHWFMDAHVVAGKETEVEFVMPVGVTITGIVVSSLGVPVAGAEVALESRVVATTDGQGRFTVRGAAEERAIGARAVGHGPSKAQRLNAHDGRAEVRLELGPTGGIVDGVVLDPDGKPLADLRVTIGQWEGGVSRIGDAPPRPAGVRTDAEGRFHAIGIAPGAQLVQALASGFVPWSGICQVTADAPAAVTIAFVRGNTLRGTLHDAEGRPFGDVLVSALAGKLDWDEVIDADGTFAIEGLPVGELLVKVDAEGRGEAHARVQMGPGGTVTTCELKLECAVVGKGHVRDESGQPLPNVSVRWNLPPPKHVGYTSTDQEGAFSILNAPDGKLTIFIEGESIVMASFENVDPRAGEIDLRAHRRAPKTVYIAGTVLDPDGRPAAARAWASGGGSNGIVEKAVDAAGYFEIGPVPPGEWVLVVESRSFPRVWFERRAIEANTRWDVGTIRLAQGGDVHVEVVEGDAEGLWFDLQDAKERGYALSNQDGKATSELLPAGSYRVLVGGKAKAAQSIPFAIRAGETTKLDVRARTGVRQQFDLELPAKLERPYGSLRILRGGDVVAKTWAERAEGKLCTAETWLEPGDYSVSATFGELLGSATFTVGGREGDPVRIAVSPPRK